MSRCMRCTCARRVHGACTLCTLHCALCARDAWRSSRAFREISRRSFLMPACPAIAPAAPDRFRSRPTTKSAAAPRRSRRSRAAASCRRGRSSPASAISSASVRSTTRRSRSIEQWAKSGAPEGDPKQLPALPKFADGWLLGKPDLIVKPDAAYSLPAQQTDAFRIFAIRLPVTKRTYVTGIEFHPGNARVVHHANIRIDRTPATRRLDEADPLPGYDGLMPRSAEYPGRAFPRLDAGTDRAAGAAGAGLDARTRQRSRGAAAPAAERRGRRGLAGDRSVFQRSHARPHADDPPAGFAGHRHSSRRIALRDSRFLRPAGRRAAARRPAARALPREGDSRRRRSCPTARRAS